MTISKVAIRAVMSRDFQQIKSFPIFRELDRECFSTLYAKMIPVVMEKPASGNRPVYNIGDTVDALYVVRQGKCSELHPIPCVNDERKLSFCRYYRAG